MRMYERKGGELIGLQPLVSINEGEVEERGSLSIIEPLNIGSPCAHVGSCSTAVVLPIEYRPANFNFFPLSKFLK